jgi:exopolysaccharide biosynthesis protein
MPWVILLDLVLLAAGLMIFSLFHHVLVRDVQTTGLSLPRPTSATTSMLETIATDATTSTGKSIDTQSDSSGSTDTGGSNTETAAVSTAETTADPNDWRIKFADQFTEGSVIQTETEYRSANIAITVDQVLRGDAVYYLADIFLSDIEQFRTAFATGVYGRSLRDEVLDMAVTNNAILAISGDYYGIRDQGIVIRNGELYRDVLFQDVLVMYYDGSMETTTKADFNMDRILAEGAWQAWSFGPMLLDKGQPMTRFNSQVTPDNPRGAIGYYEPGHYCFVLVDGRQPGYSNGMTMTELSKLFYDLGCTVAYNLDGGESAVMTFLDRVANHPYKDGRQISDIVYIAETGLERTSP